MGQFSMQITLFGGSVLGAIQQDTFQFGGLLALSLIVPSYTFAATLIMQINGAMNLWLTKLRLIGPSKGKLTEPDGFDWMR